MKVLRLVVFGIVLFLAGTLQAQVSVNVNLGSPPQWGPVGYPGVRYYYLPDVQAYYDVQTSLFIYTSGGVWVHRTYLPSRYRNYDLYGGYKVVMTDYHGTRPYSHYKEHRTKYAKGYRGHEQHNIGTRPSNGHTYQNGHAPKKSYKAPKHSNNQGNGNKGNDHNNGHGKK
jgi:hypothetical protein